MCDLPQVGVNDAMPLAHCAMITKLNQSVRGRVVRGRKGWQLAGSAVIALAMLSPAVGAYNPAKVAKNHVSLSARGGLGSFTPAMADPRLTALLARGGLASNGLRFTPAVTSLRLNRSVTVAVRADLPTGVRGNERAALVAPSQSGIAPIAYNLGLAIGWKRFALSGDVAKVDLGRVGGREALDLGLSYSAPNGVPASRLGPIIRHPIRHGRWSKAALIHLICQGLIHCRGEST